MLHSVHQAQRLGTTTLSLSLLCNLWLSHCARFLPQVNYRKTQAMKAVFILCDLRLKLLYVTLGLSRER